MPTVTRLHLSYRQRMGALRIAALAAVLTAERGDDIEAWKARIVAAVLDAQRQAVGLTDGYLSAEAGLATGTSTDPWGVDAERIIGRNARRGVLLEDVYGRNLIAAAGSLRSRMEREVNTDITLAERATAKIHTEGDPRIIGYRRVLGAGPNCGLCVAASTRRYHKAELRPIHSHCSCSTQPIYGEADAPQVDKQFLNRLYERAGSPAGSALGRITVDDSELPPGVKPDDLPEVLVTEDAELGAALVAA